MSHKISCKFVWFSLKDIQLKKIFDHWFFRRFDFWYVPIFGRPLNKSCPSNSLIFLFEISGHLDRVVHGHIADDILTACDEHTVSVNVGENVGSNPALHFFRGLRHRNLAAIKLAAQSGINQIQGQKSAVDQIQVSSLNFFWGL